MLEKLKIKMTDHYIDFYFRKNSVGDAGVIKQIFVDQDYEIFSWAQGRALNKYHLQQSNSSKSLIIDAGANIGASVVFFKARYQNSFVYSIEPDLDNWNILQQNTVALGGVYNFLGAISNSVGLMSLSDPGKSDWGFRTELIDSGSDIENRSCTKSINMDYILKDPVVMDAAPLIFKIDIEGAEKFLFSGNVDWIDAFPLIIIELHDWMLPFQGTSRDFLKSISMYDFDFLHKGENIFLFNRRLLRDFL